MTELKVGLLALASILSLVFLSLKVTTNQSGFGNYIPYKTVVSDAAGIFPKTPIKIAGINSGRITDIELSGNQAVIHFEVLDSVSVGSNSYLKVKTVGFLGDKYIEIVLGEGKAALAAGTMIRSEAGGGIEDLTRDASEVMKDLKSVLGAVKKSLAPEGEKSPIKVVMENVVEITEEISKLSSSLSRVVTDNEDKLSGVIDNLDKMMSSMEYQTNMSNKDSLMTDLKKIGDVLDNAKEATSDLKIMIADLKAGKGTIGKLMRDEQVIDQVTETLSGVQKIVNKVDAIQTELSIFTVINSETDSKSDFSLSILPSPERFYLLGITTSEVGVERKSEITTSVNGGTESIESRKEVEKDSFTFNVQIGRKVQNWSFRIGLIESSGGIGIDYRVPSWGTTFTFEAFDYSDDLGPNLRILSHVHLWNVFYGKLGFEDMISKKDEQSYTIGAGLRFNDEDLKGLIGFLL